MSDDRVDDGLARVRRELGAVTPSPRFAAAVRARVGTGLTSRSWPFTTWMVPVGLAAGASVIVAVVWAGSRSQPVVAPRAERVTAAAPPVSPAAAPVSPPPSAPRIVRRLPALASAGLANITNAAEPQLEVVTNQGQVLRAIWARVRGPVTESEVGTDVPRATEAAVEMNIGPIQVEPIVVRAIDPSASGGGAPIIRRVATDATRSER